MAVLIENLTTYKDESPPMTHTAKLRSSRYRADHERAIILHEAAAKALQTAGIKKLPEPYFAASRI